jgi:hypothetical protein
MSFIHEDKWLIQELLKLAQDTPAPVPAQPQSDAAKSLAVAKELIKNLQNELSGGFSFTAGRDNADLSQAHVVNVDELLNFLEYNQIKANGHELVMKANVFIDPNGKIKQSAQELAKWYVPYPQVNPDYYLYKDGMIAFLKDLEEKATNNPMLKAIVGKLKATLSAVLPEKKTPATDVAGDSAVPHVEPQPVGGAGGKGKVSAQAINNVIARLPFTRRDIDFARIRAFFDAVEPLLQHVPQAAVYINDVKTLMARMNSELLANGEAPVPLGLNAGQLANMLKGAGDTSKGIESTQGSRILPTLQYLNRIIDGTRSVIDLFFSQYGTGDFFSNDARSAIRRQIGFNQTDQSDYSVNSDWLGSLQSSLSFK